MTEDFLQNIFEPFERAEDERVSKQQGTGLGMPITYNLVKMMNGDIHKYLLYSYAVAYDVFVSDIMLCYCFCVLIGF